MHNAAYSLAASAVGPVFSCISVTLTGHSSGPCRAAYACCFFARLSTPIHRSGKLRAKCFHEKKSSQSRDPSPQYNLDCRCIERTLHKHMQPGYKIPYFKSSSRFQAASTFLEHPCQRLCVPRRLSVSGNASSIIRCAAIFVRLMRNRCAYALLTFFSIIVVSVMTVPGSPICASLGFSAGSLQFLWSVESTLG